MLIEVLLIVTAISLGQAEKTALPLQSLVDSVKATTVAGGPPLTIICKSQAPSGGLLLKAIQLKEKHGSSLSGVTLISCYPERSALGGLPPALKFHLEHLQGEDWVAVADLTDRFSTLDPEATLDPYGGLQLTGFAAHSALAGRAKYRFHMFSGDKPGLTSDIVDCFSVRPKDARK